MLRTVEGQREGGEKRGGEGGGLLLSMPLLFQIFLFFFFFCHYELSLAWSIRKGLVICYKKREVDFCEVTLCTTWYTTRIHYV